MSSQSHAQSPWNDCKVSLDHGERGTVDNVLINLPANWRARTAPPCSSVHNRRTGEEDDPAKGPGKAILSKLD